MLIERNDSTMNEPPTVVADLNGDIMYLNSQAMSNLGDIKVGDSVSRFIDVDYISKMNLNNRRIDIFVPKNCDYNKAVIKILGSGFIKTVELYFFRSRRYTEQEKEEDRRLFASFNDILLKEINGNLNLETLSNQIINHIKMDLRFAYRNFTVNNLGGDSELLANFAHVGTIIAATVITLNEIEYKNTIKIELNKIGENHIIEISVPVNSFVNREGFYVLGELYPQISMRLMYIASLCECDDISHDIIIKPNCISIKYVLTDMVNKTEKFSASVSFEGIRDVAAFALEHFAQRYVEPIETEAEGQEEV